LLSFTQQYFSTSREGNAYGPDYLASAVGLAKETKFDRAAAEMARLRSRTRDPVATYAASVLEGDFRTKWAAQLLKDGKTAQARYEVELVEKAYSKHLHLSTANYNLGYLYVKLDEPEKARYFLSVFSPWNRILLRPKRSCTFFPG
jgi:hypothetical protein